MLKRMDDICGKSGIMVTTHSLNIQLPLLNTSFVLPPLFSIHKRAFIPVKDPTPAGLPWPPPDVLVMLYSSAQVSPICDKFNTVGEPVYVEVCTDR